MMSVMEHEITSDEVDRLFAEDPDAGVRLPPNPDVRVHLEVPMDGAMLRVLQQRADREGRSLTDVVRDAVRAGAAAA